MARAGPEALARLENCLSVLRPLDGIVVRKHGIFYRRAEAFLHVHAEAGMLCAGIKLAPGAPFTHMPADTASGQRRLLAAAAGDHKT